MRKIYFILMLPLIVPHLICYRFSKNRWKIDADVERYEGVVKKNRLQGFETGLSVGLSKGVSQFILLSFRSMEYSFTLPAQAVHALHQRSRWKDWRRTGHSTWIFHHYYG